MDVALIDEVAGQAVRPMGTASFATPTITVRELIAARVALHWEQRAEAVGEGGGRGWGGLLTRHDDTLADAPLPRMLARAEEAFVSGRYFLLLDDRQAQDLDERVELTNTGSATFLLLTPLKGG